MATTDVGEFCVVSHVGDGTIHSTAHLSNFCMSPCQIDFQISLKNSFVLATFMAHRSSNSDAGRWGSPCAIIFVCVMVSLTALQGHSSGTYHISVQYLHVVEFYLVLRECRHCTYIFVTCSVETSWPCSIQFLLLLGPELGNTVQCDSCQFY